MPQQINTSDSSDAAQKRRAVWWYWGTALVLSICLLLTYYLPDSWNRDVGPLSALVSIMISIVPSISVNASFSSFPGVAETFLSIVWVATIITTYLAARRKYTLDRRTWIPQKGRWVVFWGVVLVYGLAIGAFYVGATPPKNECYWRDVFYCPMLKSMGDSRFWLAVFGTVTYSVGSSIFVATIVGARNFRRLWLSSSDQSSSHGKRKP